MYLYSRRVFGRVKNFVTDFGLRGMPLSLADAFLMNPFPFIKNPQSVYF